MRRRERGLRCKKFCIRFAARETSINHAHAQAGTNGRDRGRRRGGRHRGPPAALRRDERAGHGRQRPALRRGLAHPARWIRALGPRRRLDGSRLLAAEWRRCRRGHGGVFHNVYIEPTAYAYYVRTGKFREKTMMAMTLWQPGQKVHPSKQGFFEGEFLAMEFSVKDSRRFPGSLGDSQLRQGRTRIPLHGQPAAGVSVVPRRERGRRQCLRAVLPDAEGRELQVRSRQAGGRRQQESPVSALDRRGFVRAGLTCGGWVLACLAGATPSTRRLFAAAPHR